MRYSSVNSNKNSVLIRVTVLAISMGFLESAVVVYLREIYYPGGFEFPLKVISGKIAVTEILREAATLLMLMATGWLAGRTRTGKFGAFLLAFGIWDICYYVFLKMLLGWPDSLLTWDILFLIPVTWVGPVLAPVINALTMCILGGFLLLRDNKGVKVKIRPVEWSLLIFGSLVIMASYTMDYLRFMSSRIPLVDLFRQSKIDHVMRVTEQYVPQYFNWWVFGIGQGMLTLAVFLIFHKTITEKR